MITSGNHSLLVQVFAQFALNRWGKKEWKVEIIMRVDKFFVSSIWVSAHETSIVAKRAPFVVKKHVLCKAFYTFKASKLIFIFQKCNLLECRSQLLNYEFWKTFLKDCVTSKLTFCAWLQYYVIIWWLQIPDILWGKSYCQIEIHILIQYLQTF